MSSTKVKGWMLVKCLEEHKVSWHKRRAEEHEKYEKEMLSSRVRTKWWQYWLPKTIEEAWHSDHFLVWRYKDSTPEAAESDWHDRWGKIKRLADYAVNTDDDVVLDDEHSFLLTYYKP